MIAILALAFIAVGLVKLVGYLAAGVILLLLAAWVNS